MKGRERKGKGVEVEGKQKRALVYVSWGKLQTSKGKGGRSPACLTSRRMGGEGIGISHAAEHPGPTVCLSALSLAISTYRCLSLGNLSN